MTTYAPAASAAPWTASTPREGHQLAMFEQRTQHVPTEGEALRSLFELAGKSAAYERGGQRAMML